MTSRDSEHYIAKHCSFRALRDQWGLQPAGDESPEPSLALVSCDWEPDEYSCTDLAKVVLAFDAANDGLNEGKPLSEALEQLVEQYDLQVDIFRLVDDDRSGGLVTSEETLGKDGTVLRVLFHDGALSLLVPSLRAASVVKMHPFLEQECDYPDGSSQGDDQDGDNTSRHQCFQGCYRGAPGRGEAGKRCGGR